jgi:2'-5' RNA ligase
MHPALDPRDILKALEARWAPTLLLSQAVPITSEPEPVMAAAEIHTGVMVAIFPTPEHAATLALDGGEDAGNLHITLAYLGQVQDELGIGDLTDADEPRIIEAVAGWAAQIEPFDAFTNGLGVFHNDPPVTYASVDAPKLPPARQTLIGALADAGIAVNHEHGFIPHMTLAYTDERHISVPRLAWKVEEVVIAFAGRSTRIGLGRPTEAAAVIATLPGDDTGVHVSDRGSGETGMLSTPVEPQMNEGAKAFVADINGRTIITGPARTIAAMKEPTVEDITAKHMLWMHGRFVGAETPNRNGALWSAGDLQMAKGSVVNGPLNWLHDARHVIGTLAKADFIDGSSQSPRVDAASGEPVKAIDPHITATAAIWRWIYPDEAYVVQQASDQEMLWYSMECISKEVSCVGPTGCGNTTSYTDYMAGAACDHVRQRASVRRFIDPVFLGGAVIVPPTRPGWAEADARVMSSANALAEAAFDQAGRPDVSASDWEQLMSQVIRFADK